MSKAEDKRAGIVDEDPARAALIAKTRMTLADNEEYLSLFSESERAGVELALAGKKPLDTIPLPVVNFEEEVEMVAFALWTISGLQFRDTSDENMLRACVAFSCTYSWNEAVKRHGRNGWTRFDDLLHLVGLISNGTAETPTLDGLALEISTGLRVVDIDTKRFTDSALRRHDGVKPAETLRPDGSRGLGPNEDLFLREYLACRAVKKVASDSRAATSCRRKMRELLPLACESVRNTYCSRAEKREATLAERARKARLTALRTGYGADAVEALIVDGLCRFINDDSIGEPEKLRALTDLESLAREIEDRSESTHF